MNTIKYLTIIILAFLSVQCCEKTFKETKKNNNWSGRKNRDIRIRLDRFHHRCTLTYIWFMLDCYDQSNRKEKGYPLYLWHAAICFFCFKTNGSYLFKISDKGNGPEEYQHIEHFSVSETGEIFLLEPWGNIYQYSNKGVFKQKSNYPMCWNHTTKFTSEEIPL